MRIAVAGGTGVVGKHVDLERHRQGCDTVLQRRDDEPARRGVMAAGASQEVSRARIRSRAVLLSPMGTSRPAWASPDFGMLL
jgi:hypothetical protein